MGVIIRWTGLLDWNTGLTFDLDKRGINNIAIISISYDNNEFCAAEYYINYIVVKASPVFYHKLCNNGIQGTRVASYCIYSTYETALFAQSGKFAHAQIVHEHVVRISWRVPCTFVSHSLSVSPHPSLYLSAQLDHMFRNELIVDEISGDYLSCETTYEFPYYFYIIFHSQRSLRPQSFTMSFYLLFLGSQKET